MAALGGAWLGFVLQSRREERREKRRAVHEDERQLARWEREDQLRWQSERAEVYTAIYREVEDLVEHLGGLQDCDDIRTAWPDPAYQQRVAMLGTLCDRAMDAVKARSIVVSSETRSTVRSTVWWTRGIADVAHTGRTDLYNEKVRGALTIARTCLQLMRDELGIDLSVPSPSDPHTGEIPKVRTPRPR